MAARSIKVIFDTNIWISFLIGKRLATIKSKISDGSISLVIAEQLLAEIRTVTSRPKLQKYFPSSSVEELIELMLTIGEMHEISPTNFICRDPKDNFLLDLIESSKADYLVTGDKDLLEHNPFKTAQIVTPSAFEELLTR